MGHPPFGIDPCAPIAGVGSPCIMAATVNEVPQDPCDFRGGNPDPSFWAKMGADAKWNPLILWEDAAKGFAKGGISTDRYSRAATSTNELRTETTFSESMQPRRG